MIGKQSNNPVNCQLGDVEIWHPHAYRSDLGGMVNNSATGNSYVPTTSSPVYLPRVGHHIYNGSAWVNEGILHESEARTNLVTYSNDFTNSSWTKNQSTITATASVSPDGETSASEYLITGSSGYLQHVSTVVADTSHTSSCYIKKGLTGGSAQWLQIVFRDGSSGLQGWFDISNGVIGSTNTFGTGSVLQDTLIEDVGGGYFRCSATGSVPSTSGRMQVYQVTANGSNSRDQTNGIYIYGAQLEVGATPSSYIPTSGSQVTRAADTLTVPAANLPYSSTNVSIQMDGKMTYADTGVSASSSNNVGEVTFLRWQEASNQFIGVVLNTLTSRVGQVSVRQRNATDGFDEVTSAVDSYTPDTNVPFNIASRHGSTFINGAVDGTALTANTTPTALPDLSSTNLELGHTFMGTISKFRMWDEDLTDLGIAEASS